MLTVIVQEEINQKILNPDKPSNYPNPCNPEKHNFESQQYTVSMNISSRVSTNPQSDLYNPDFTTGGLHEYRRATRSKQHSRAGNFVFSLGSKMKIAMKERKGDLLMYAQGVRGW